MSTRPRSALLLLSLAACSAASRSISTDAGGSPPADAHDATADVLPVSDGGSPDAGGHDGATGDAGSTHPDGSGAADASDGGAGDATVDGSAEGGAWGTTCGGAQCYAGQSCVGGACAWTGCTGSHVPGDYATVQAAVTALGSGGGTICLGAQTYAESVQASPATPLTLQGISPSQTTLTSIIVSGGGGVTLQGMTLQGVTTSAASGNLVVRNCTIDASSTGNFGVDVQVIGGALDVTLDGVDVRAGTSTAVRFLVQDFTSNFVTGVIENSYIHDSSVGFQYVDQTGNGAGPFATVSLVNDTFLNDGTALLLDTQDPGVSVSYYDDVIRGSTLAVNLSQYVTAASGTNDYFGNTTNFGGSALDGAGDLKSDPVLLSTTTPPAPGAGSPLIRAGDAAHATPHDFWGNPRGTQADLGAVQVSH